MDDKSFKEPNIVTNKHLAEYHPEKATLYILDCHECLLKESTGNTCKGTLNESFNLFLEKCKKDIIPVVITSGWSNCDQVYKQVCNALNIIAPPAIRMATWGDEITCNYAQLQNGIMFMQNIGALGVESKWSCIESYRALNLNTDIAKVIVVDDKKENLFPPKNLMNTPMEGWLYQPINKRKISTTSTEDSASSTEENKKSLHLPNSIRFNLAKPPVSRKKPQSLQELPSPYEIFPKEDNVSSLTQIP